MDKEELEKHGMTYHMSGEQPGMSVFGKERIYIFHKYSLYARGNDKLLGTYLPLAMTPLGGQDSINGGLGLPYHD